MKAAVYTAYGPPEVLSIKEIEKPVPRDKEILVKILATTAHIGDSRMRALNIPKGQKLLARLYLGIWKPRRKVLGMELAGIVEEVGKKVTRFKPGDEVFALTVRAGLGAYAEYKCLAEKGHVALKPTNLSFSESAAVPCGAVTALGHMKKAKIKKGDSVLIYGASGSVGSYAVQIAKHFGAEVTGVCSGANTDLVKSLGAKKVIDYTKEDFTQSGDKYDVVFDAVAKFSPVEAKKVLKKGGSYHNVHGSSSGKTFDKLLEVKNIIEQGVLKPLIDKSYSLDNIVEAHRYIDKEHKKGHVIITVNPD